MKGKVTDMREKWKSPVAVTRSSLPPLEEYVEMLKPLWESAWLTNMGDYHEPVSYTHLTLPTIQQV